MGEVIDQHQMIKRMKTKLYKNNNYMVQLKHDEIIDATRKGNITRFINHSCEPNCVAEKWNVLGESRMGFFTKVPIFKGEEITFDYSFEIFGDAAQQKCYCNAPKCRGFISKKSRTGDDQSSSDESEDNEDDILTSKSDEREEKKKKITVKKITNKDKKRLRELDRQLTDISRLKNKNRSDLESSTLNLNKLMVHITDSMSQSHILKFIRENDLNCKRLFMNFNGLSIIHSWMISSNNENLKLEIIQTLSELPISNRNTITKSKVLDIVAEWAKIPFSIKENIENLDYPVSKSEEHGQEIDKLLPDDKNISLLAQAARVLWKKWIILKMVFKIPKLERPKDVSIPCDIQPSIILSQPKPKLDQCNFEKPLITTSQNSILDSGNLTNKINNISFVQNQEILGHGLTNPMDKFSKIIDHQIQINNQEKNKAVFEWNKKYWDYTALKTNKVNSSSAVNSPNKLILNTNHVSTTELTSDILEIPTIEGNLQSKKVKWSIAAQFTPAVYEVPTCDSTSKPASMCNISNTEPIDYNSIEIITTSNKAWDPPLLTIDELKNGFTLESILKTVPPSLSNNYVSNQCDKTTQYLNFYDSSLMNPENVMYEAQHPSIEEQSLSWSTEPILNFPTKTVIDILETNSKEKKLDKDNIDVLETNSKETNLDKNNIDILKSNSKEKDLDKNNIDILETNSKETDSNKNNIAVQPVTAEDTEKILFEQCQNNLKKLIGSGLLDISKSARENFIDQSPIKITDSFFKRKSQSQHKNDFILPNFFKRLKIISNFYREQPSKLVKINNFKSKCTAPKNKNNVFRIIEDNKTVKTDATSVALKFHDEQLNTAPQNLNIGKLLKKQTIEINTENKFAYKIFNGLKKKYLNMPKQFTLPIDTKVYTLDPKKEIELHHKLIPTVKNTLCGKLIKDNSKDTINVFKQEIIMKYDESKSIPRPILSLEEVFKENLTKPKNISNNKEHGPIKRKMPLHTSHKVKSRKAVDSHINKSNNIVTVTNEKNDDVIFKKPMVPINRKKSLKVSTSLSNKRREQVISKPMTQNTAVLKRNTNEIRQGPITSGQIMSSKALLRVNANEVAQEPSTSNQTTPSITLLKTNANEIRQKPLMKCLPFNKVDNILDTELEQNAKNLATYLSMNYTTNEIPISQTNSELIDSIVDNFNASVTSKKTMNRTNLSDDPIVRDYIQRTQLKTLETKRKCKLPESMMSLPVEVLNLVPDNQREIKYVIDFYHAMATVIVKVLDSYVKKSCKQGRIKNDEDFKYLAKKLNSNILFKELQVKKVEELKITDSVKQKVEQYIKKYMLKYGKVYRRKSTDQ
uniref:[histone H3]-lysine(36) N-trimethyltransferase n=2 Tax=Sipha flava TaxID=143950 RepID=A0A2S2Q0E3_9HEMI